MTAASAITVWAIGLPTLPAPLTARARKRVSKYCFTHEHGRNNRMDEMPAATLRVTMLSLDTSNRRRCRIHSDCEHAVLFGARPANTSFRSVTAYSAVPGSDDRVGARRSLRYVSIGAGHHYPIAIHNAAPVSNGPVPVTIPQTEDAAKWDYSVSLFPDQNDDGARQIYTALAGLTQTTC